MPEPSTPSVPPAPWRRWPSLDLLYALCALLLALSLFRTELLPFVDYPQHLHMAGLLQGVWRGDTGASAAYESHLFNYNVGFHVLTAALGFVLPLALAGRLVVVATLLLLAASSWRVLRALDTPPAYAFVALLGIPGYWLAWGFVNYGLGLGVGLLLVERYLRADADWRPRDHLLVVLLGLLTLWIHLLSLALCVALAGAALIVHLAHDLVRRQPWPQACRTHLRRLPALLSPLLGAALVRLYEEAAHLPRQPPLTEMREGAPLLDRVLHFPSLTSSIRSDQLDADLLGVALGVMLLGLLLPARRPSPLALALLVVVGLAYLLCPLDVWLVAFVYPRLGLLVLLALIASCPPPRLRLVQLVQQGVLPLLAVLHALLFVDLMGDTSRELADLATLAQTSPPLRLTGLGWKPYTPSFTLPVLLHAPAYVAAYGKGDISFSFTRALSAPIHERADHQSPRAPQDLEWRPPLYDPQASYARSFPTLLIHTPDPARPPRSYIPRLPPDWSLDEVARQGSWSLVTPRPPSP